MNRFYSRNLCGKLAKSDIFELATLEKLRLLLANFGLAVETNKPVRSLNA